jgi:hypothetical protein
VRLSVADIVEGVEQSRCSRAVAFSFCQQKRSGSSDRTCARNHRDLYACRATPPRPTFVTRSNHETRADPTKRSPDSLSLFSFARIPEARLPTEHNEFLGAESQERGRVESESLRHQRDVARTPRVYLRPSELKATYVCWPGAVRVRDHTEHSARHVVLPVSFGPSIEIDGWMDGCIGKEGRAPCHMPG